MELKDIKEETDLFDGFDEAAEEFIREETNVNDFRISHKKLESRVELKDKQNIVISDAFDAAAEEFRKGDVNDIDSVKFYKNLASIVEPHNNEKLDMLEGFDEAAEEFIKDDVIERDFVIYIKPYLNGEPKDKQKSDGNYNILVDEFDDEEHNFVQENKTEESKYLSKLDNETAATTSVEKCIPKLKKSPPCKIIQLKAFDCKICGDTFAQNAAFTCHMRKHNSERSYKCSKLYDCEICDYSSVKKNNLIRHMRTHTGERPFTCSFCPATFADAATVKIHHYTHTKERPFVCGICGKSFTSNRLKKHKREAHNVIEISETPHKITMKKPHECDICGSSFLRKHHLTRHMRIHTGERPFKCSYCPADFADAYSQRAHHRIHTKERPFACGICGKSFTSNVLKKHKRDEHNVIDCEERPQINK